MSAKVIGTKDKQAGGPNSEHWAEYVKMVKSHNSRFNSSYAERSANSVFNRFKKMSKFSLKLIGIESQTGDPPSGDTDKEEWEKKVKDAFLERVPDAGTLYEAVVACKLFLEGIPKWRTYQEEEDKREETGKKRVRPSGTKAAKQKEQDKRVIQGFLSGSSVDGSAIETQRQKHHKKTESFMVNVAQSLGSFVNAFSQQLENANKQME